MFATCATCSEHARHAVYTTTQPFVHPFIPPSVRPSIYSFVRLFACLFSASISVHQHHCPSIYPFDRPLICSLVYSFIGSFVARSFTSLPIQCTFPGLSVCPFPPVRSPPATCFVVADVLVVHFGKALLAGKGINVGVGYERHGSYRPSGVFVPVFPLLAWEAG